jgi:bacteriocin-like protein
MTGSDKAKETLTAAPDALLKTGKDANIELSEKDLESVSGGDKTDTFKQMQDMTNNKQTTAQKAADKADQYIRS